jgi:AcrR family transcriptional regulator
MSAESPARMDPIERREQILSCALRLFEQSSYAEVSTAAIAAAAGVARPLIHHYFGTKRELYLEVVRRITNLPPMALRELPLESRRASVEAVVDHWISVVTRHRRMWLATVKISAQGGDAEVQRIISDADTALADRLIRSLGIDLGDEGGNRLRAGALSYGAMIKELSRQWLVHETLTADDVRRLAVSVLLGILDEFAPVDA